MNITFEIRIFASFFSLNATTLWIVVVICSMYVIVFTRFLFNKLTSAQKHQVIFYNIIFLLALSQHRAFTIHQEQTTNSEQMKSVASIQQKSLCLFCCGISFCIVILSVLHYQIQFRFPFYVATTVLA